MEQKTHKKTHKRKSHSTKKSLTAKAPEKVKKESIISVDFERVKRVFELDGKVYSEISHTDFAMKDTVTVLILAYIIGHFWLIFPSIGILIPFLFVVVPLSWLFGGILYHVLAKVVGGKASLWDYLKSTGFASAPIALGIIPAFGYTLGIVMVYGSLVLATKEVHQISLRRALFVILFPTVTFVFCALVMLLFFMSTLRWM